MKRSMILPLLIGLAAGLAAPQAPPPTLAAPVALPAVPAIPGQVCEMVAPPAPVAPLPAALIAQAVPSAPPTPRAAPAPVAAVAPSAPPAPAMPPVLVAQAVPPASAAPHAAPAPVAPVAPSAPPAPAVTPVLIAQAVPPAPPTPRATPAPVAPAAPSAPPVPAMPPVPPMPFTEWYDWGKGSFLGIGVQEVDEDRAKELKLPEEAGVEVTTVTENSPAVKAGLKEGDVVLEFNGQKVEGVEQFVRMVRETPPGRQVKLRISRNGAPQTITATVGTRKKFAMDPKWQGDMQKLNDELRRSLGPDSEFQRKLQSELGADSKFQHEMQKLREDLGNMRLDLAVPDIPEGITAWKNRVLGVEAEAVGPQLAEFFGVKQGVLVRSVVKGSVAEKAGIKAGDVITKLGEAEVSRPGDLSSHFRSWPSAKTLPVLVVRNKQQLTLKVMVPTNPDASGRWKAPEQRFWRQDFTPSKPFRGRLVSLPSDSL